MSDRHKGSCLCGAVTFETRGPLRGVLFCHCSQCRKQSGHIYAMTKVADADLEVSGAEAIAWYAASDAARRGFCRTCGSVLFWKADALDTTSIAAGAFDAPSGLHGESHVFCADKGDYYEITDDLPQFVQR